MPVYAPIAPPFLESAKAPHELTPDQASMTAKVLEHFSKPDYILPGIEKGELDEEEKFWLSYECILRYLRAVKWASAEKAIHRIEVTMKWRREYGISDVVTASHVEPEAVTGKEIIFGYDAAGHPACYMVPSRQNTTEGARQIQFAVWMLERSIDLMGCGVEKMDLLINFADRAKNPSFGVARAVLNILQDHYPERLGLALIINVPYLINMFFKLILPFVDPVTRLKIRFNPDVLKEGIFTPDMLMKQWWGGDQDFEYSHEKYWPELVRICEERKRKQLESWRALGGKVGLKEWDVKREAFKVGSVHEKTLEPENAEEAKAPVQEAPLQEANPGTD